MGGKGKMKRVSKSLSQKEKKIIVSYQKDITQIEERFYDELKKEKIKAARCRKCKKLIFPPPQYCPWCSQKISPSDLVDVGNSGKVISQAIVHYLPSEDFPLSVPFSMLAIRVGKSDSVFILPTQRTDVYLGDRVRIFLRRQKERKGNIFDIDIEKL
jgi:Predicted nucleic-acid-binding protein containing a Zn-ribbon